MQRRERTWIFLPFVVEHLLPSAIAHHLNRLASSCSNELKRPHLEDAVLVSRHAGELPESAPSKPADGDLAKTWRLSNELHDTRRRSVIYRLPRLHCGGHRCNASEIEEEDLEGFKLGGCEGGKDVIL